MSLAGRRITYGGSVILSKSLNSLTYLIRKKERDWRSQNRLLRQLSYKGFPAWLFGCADAPLKNATEILILSLLLSMNFACWGEVVGVEAICWSSYIGTSWGSNANLLNLFTAVWTIQATVAALTYPIVIAFVTILVQRNASSGVLKAYFIDSGAVFAGLSSLFVLLGMLAQYVLIVYSENNVGNRTLAVWLMLDSVWVALNFVLTAWFLLRTFMFLRPSARKEILKRYVASVVWPRELKSKLVPLLYSYSQQFGWVPGPGAHDTEQRAPRVWMHSIGFDIGQSIVAVSLRGRLTLYEVRFRLLAIVASRWLRSARATNWSQAAEGEPTLVFPSLPGRNYEDKVILCRVQGHSLLNRLDKLLVRLAFGFRRARDLSEEADETKEFFGDLEAEASSAIRDNRTKPFDDALSALKELHATLIMVSEFRGDDGIHDNYTKVLDDVVWGHPIEETWARMYFSLFENAVNRLTENDHFFRALAYMPGHLLWRCRDTKGPGLKQTFVNMPRVLMRRLGTWWVRTLERSGKVDYGPGAPYVLQPPFYSIYEQALIGFVGAWESIKENYFLTSHRESRRTWNDFVEWWPNYEAHLDNTGQMLVEAVARGDTRASEWLAGAIQRWLARSEVRFSGHGYGIRHRKLATPAIFTFAWREVVSHLGIDEERVSGPLEEEAFVVTAKNYWTDIRFLLTYIFFEWGAVHECSMSLPALLIRGFIDGNTWHGGGEPHSVTPMLQDPKRVLESLLRQNFGDHARNGAYERHLDQLIERFMDTRSADVVPGRIYSRSGADDLRSLVNGQLLVLCVASVRGSWGDQAGIDADTRGWMSEGTVATDVIDYLERLVNNLNAQNFGRYRPIFQCVIGADREGPEFGRAIESTRSNLANVVTLVRSLRDQALQEAVISQELLRQAAASAESAAFSATDAPIPIRFFPPFSFVTNDVLPYRLAISGLNKGEFTEQEIVHRYHHEGEAFGRAMRDHVAAKIMFEVFRLSQIEMVDASTPDAYWDELKRAAAALQQRNGTPILLLANAARPDWVWDWQHADYGQEDFHRRPADLRFTQTAEGPSERYVGHFNDIAIFTAPVEADRSYVVAREMFERLSFYRTSEGHLVTPEWRQSGTDYAKGDLLLKWGAEIHLANLPVKALQHSAS